MNAQALSLHRPELRPTQARFTVDDVDRMVEAGLLDPDLSTELLDGDLILMPSEGELHLMLKTRLIRAFTLRLGEAWLVVPDGTLHLSPSDAPEPDMYVVAEGSRLKPVAAAAVPLVVEVADTSLAHDLGRKASKYSDYGISEYWVVDIRGRQTHVLTQPGPRGYRDIGAVAFDQPLTVGAFPRLSLILSDLEL